MTLRSHEAKMFEITFYDTWKLFELALQMNGLRNAWGGGGGVECFIKDSYEAIFDDYWWQLMTIDDAWFKILLNYDYGRTDNANSRVALRLKIQTSCLYLGHKDMRVAWFLME